MVVAVTLAAGLALAYVGVYAAAAPVFLLSVALAWLHALPRRQAPAAPRALLSPVDGRVARVEPHRDPWLERDVLRISIALTPPGITVFFSPTEGEAGGFWTRFGPFGEARLKRSLSASPDCYALHVKTDEGDDVVTVVSSRWPVSRCRFDRSPGERVGQGARLGFVYFASTFELLAPAASAPRVDVGARVRAVTTPLADLPKD